MRLCLRVEGRPSRGSECTATPGLALERGALFPEPLGSSPYPPPTAPSLGPMPLRSAAGAWACRPLPHGVSRTPGPCSVFYGRGLRNRRRGWWVSSVASRELGVHGEVLKRGMCGMIWWFGAKGSRLDVKEYSVSLKLMKTSRIQITLEVILKVCILTSYR